MASRQLWKGFFDLLHDLDDQSVTHVLLAPLSWYGQMAGCQRVGRFRRLVAKLYALRQLIRDDLSDRQRSGESVFSFRIDQIHRVSERTFMRRETSQKKCGPEVILVYFFDRQTALFRKNAQS